MRVVVLVITRQLAVGGGLLAGFSTLLCSVCTCDRNRSRTGLYFVGQPECHWNAENGQMHCNRLNTSLVFKQILHLSVLLMACFYGMFLTCSADKLLPPKLACSRGKTKIACSTETNTTCRANTRILWAVNTIATQPEQRKAVQISRCA